MSANAAKFDCSGGSSYLVKDFAGVTTAGWTITIELMVPAATYAALAGDEFTADFWDLYANPGLSGLIDGVFVTAKHTDGTNDSFPGGPKNWWFEQSPNNPVTPGDTPDVCTTLVAHWDGTTMHWSQDGTPFESYTGPPPFDPVEVAVGAHFANGVAGEIYYVASFQIKDAGGSVVFSDDFSSGDFSAWDSTHGSCTIVPNPYGGPAAPFTLAASPGSVTTWPGGPPVSSVITSTLVSGSPEPITLSASGEPTGVLTGFSANPISDDGGTSTLAITVSALASVGTSTILVTGDDGMGGIAFTSVDLHVIAVPPGTHMRGVVGGVNH